MDYTKLKSLLPISEIDEGALEQIHKALEQPFLEKLVVLPDVHKGYSLPIGAVAQLNGVISPDYVGYDIGCFSGDTKIPLLDGNNYTLKELYDTEMENFPVYSIDKNGDHKIGIADKIKLTKRNSELIKVTIDSGEEIICTPDHKFLNLDLTYTEAKDLKNRQSLFPFHRRLDRDGYEMLGVRGTSYTIPTHKVVAKSGLIGDRIEFENGTDIHHKDKNKLNNFPDNLKFIDRKEHQSLHAVDRNYFSTEDFKEKKKKTILERGYYYDPKFLEQKSKIAKDNILKYMKDNKEDFAKVVKKNAERGGKFFSNKNSDPDMTLRQKIARIKKVIKLCVDEYGEVNDVNYENCRVKFYNYPKYEKAKLIIESAGITNFLDVLKDERFSNNHKVVSIEKLDYKEDVYCMTVEKYHNFALSSGVFVHNCGVCNVITDLRADDVLTDIKIKQKIFDKIYEVIPVGFNSHENCIPINIETASGDKDLDKKVTEKWVKQLGTLGGGNHFVEIGGNQNGFLSVTIHSGSRGCGHAIADFYMKKSRVVDMDLPDGFFHLNSEYGVKYLKDMNMMLDYALANRKVMMKRILEIFGINGERKETLLFNMINETHNHAIVNGNTVTCRKGATESHAGQMGIIPSDMKNGVYIVKGLGNEEYLCSSSHGCGRLGSRRWAREQLTLDEFKDMMRGIVAKVDKSTLDEAPLAYKNADYVIGAQKGIVIDVMDFISPLINIKG